jgi:hypothetical protein
MKSRFSVDAKLPIRSSTLIDESLENSPFRVVEVLLSLTRWVRLRITGRRFAPFTTANYSRSPTAMGLLP